eukprot:8278959-Alexandrium_andersonii.AAC.1
MEGLCAQSLSASVVPLGAGPQLRTSVQLPSGVIGVSLLVYRQGQCCQEAQWQAVDWLDLQASGTLGEHAQEYQHAAPQAQIQEVEGGCITDSATRTDHLRRRAHGTSF